MKPLKVVYGEMMNPPVGFPWRLEGDGGTVTLL